MRLRTLHWPAVQENAATTGGPYSPDMVVLLHGLGDTADIWQPLMALWHPGAPAMALDLPGHGRSPWLPPDAYGVRALAKHVAEMLAEHGVTRPLLIGHSLGARVSVELAAHVMPGMRGCVLIDMSAESGVEVDSMIAGHIDALQSGRDTLEALAALVLDRLPLADQAAVAAVVSAMAVRSDGRWHVPHDPAIKRLLARTPDVELWPALAKMHGPVGLVRGMYSAVLSRADATRIAGAVPRRPVPTHEVAMAGHAIPLEQPAALARGIDACLAEMRRPGCLT